MKRSLSFAGVVLVLLVTGAACAEPLRIGGTGSAVELMRSLGKMVEAGEESHIKVVPSLGSSGGLRALEAGMLDIAVAGRGLNASELAKGLVVRAAVRSAWGLATSLRNPSGLQRASVAALYADEQARWADGTPIRVILRPKGDAENAALTEAFPGMTDALARLRSRADVPIAATGQDNADWAERVAGSLVSITALQIVTERRKLRLIAIDGVEPSFENFTSGRYPLGRTIYVVTRVQAAPVALRFIDFLKSPQGQRALRDAESALVQ